MDRLTWFIHNADRQCLDQAVEVATGHPVKLKRIEKWAQGEGPNGLTSFRAFMTLLGRGAEE
ncbi:MAG: hypothetical protein QMC74_06185 [Myxococcota bacterium]|jgi:hypothetical protein